MGIVLCERCILFSSAVVTSPANQIQVIILQSMLGTCADTPYTIEYNTIMLRGDTAEHCSAASQAMPDQLWLHVLCGRVFIPRVRS